jgi:hypothetical protein
MHIQPDTIHLRNCMELAPQIKFEAAFDDVCKKHAFLNRYVL